MSVQKRRRKAIERRNHIDAISQCDGTCHDRGSDCRKCERMVDGAQILRIVGCDDCVFYAAQDAEVSA
ncbi:MAG: hypothetical protein ACXVXP_00315 [Mycobacteriaceae bacterium]